MPLVRFRTEAHTRAVVSAHDPRIVVRSRGLAPGRCRHSSWTLLRGGIPGMRESVDEAAEWNGEISTLRCPHCGVVPIPMSGLKPSTARPLLLVVDDEPAILKIIERLAGKLGFDVVTCLS